MIEFELRGDFIPLDALLKATGLASSGGLAKRMIAGGLVRIDGEVELRKTCKIRAGQRARLGDSEIAVNAAPPAGGTATVDQNR